MSGFRIIGNIVLSVVLWIFSGSFRLILMNLSIGKVINSGFYIWWNDYCERKNIRILYRALGWECIISLLGMGMNYILIGELGIVLGIMVCMKVMIPLYMLYERLWIKR